MPLFYSLDKDEQALRNIKTEKFRDFLPWHGQPRSGPQRFAFTGCHYFLTFFKVSWHKNQWPKPTDRAPPLPHENAEKSLTTLFLPSENGIASAVHLFYESKIIPHPATLLLHSHSADKRLTIENSGPCAIYPSTRVMLGQRRNFLLCCCQNSRSLIEWLVSQPWCCFGEWRISRQFRVLWMNCFGCSVVLLFFCLCQP